MMLTIWFVGFITSLFTFGYFYDEPGEVMNEDYRALALLFSLAWPITIWSFVPTIVWIIRAKYEQIKERRKS